MHDGKQSAEAPGFYRVYENNITTDPLREDPSARVAYSDHPYLDPFDVNFDEKREQAFTPHPIQRSADSLLARPEVAEALEQIYIDGASSGTEHEVTLSPVDST